MKVASINAVIVTFNPNKQELLNCIRSLANQVEKIILVDNNSDIRDILETEVLPEFGVDKIRIIYLPENLGIAYATNVGVKESVQLKSRYTLLSDQDTEYPESYIDDMIDNFSFSYKGSFRKNIVAVCPSFFDSNSKKTYGLYSDIYLSDTITSVYQCIASGMIIDNDFWKNVGEMNDRLFIDWVDFEWCWRARDKGYCILRDNKVIITHKLGSETVSLFGRSFPKYNDLRCYYITRNAVYLYLYFPGFSIKKRFFGIISCLKYIIGYPLVSNRPLTTARFCCQALYHGVIKRLGKYD
ncbi:glycosyltransferase family 2 protein [Vibrio alginolyticus]|nr:glycosyltransferase family 2 protein [Vibrio alginolyticus]